MQKTAYEMRISDCSSDVCSSDLSSARSNAFISAGRLPASVLNALRNASPTPSPARGRRTGDPRETIGVRLGAALLVMNIKTARTTACFLVSFGNRLNERGVWHGGIASDRLRRRPGAPARAVSVQNE